MSDQLLLEISGRHARNDLSGLRVGSNATAQRIDNQLRGRSAARASGFFAFHLSMEDELMRLFGGQQAEA
jgi:preprotein translocase subunit SecA